MPLFQRFNSERVKAQYTIAAYVFLTLYPEAWKFSVSKAAFFFYLLRPDAFSTEVRVFLPARDKETARLIGNSYNNSFCSRMVFTFLFI